VEFLPNHGPTSIMFGPEANLGGFNLMAFGHPDRHYSDGVPRVPGRERSETDDQLSRLLKDLDPKLEERVNRAFRQWNQVLRDYLRTEMAFRLTVGDDAQAVPFRIVQGLPVPLRKVVQGLEERTLKLLLRLPLLETTAAGLEFLDKQNAVADASIPRAAYFIRELLKGLHSIDLQKRLSEIHEDVFGAYFYRVPEIHIYWMAIGLACTTLKVDVESLTVVVVLHELAHAYSHLGRDIDSNRWDVESFAHADLRIVEGIAQFYTSVICEKMKERYPAALSSYQALLNIQSGPYVVHKDWVKAPGNNTVSPRAGEVVRASMVECRTRGIQDYGEFVQSMKNSHGRLGAR
jgi:hypothetical protein